MKLEAYDLDDDVLPCWKRMISVQSGHSFSSMAACIARWGSGM